VTLTRCLALVAVLALLLLCYELAISNVAAGSGPYPNPTLTPPAWTAGP